VKKLVRSQGGSYESTINVDGFFEHHTMVAGGSSQANNSLHVMDSQKRLAVLRVGAPFTDDTTPSVKYHLGDHLGSSIVVVDASRGFVNREEYTPYGETTFGSFGRKRYRFTAKERDEESGLYYHGARFYAPWLGRWSSADPIGTQDGLNLYEYAKNNPVGLHDPTGTQTKSPTAAVPTPPPPKDDPTLPEPSDKPTEVGFVAKHPVIASEIGTVSHGSTNISTNAVRFSTRIGLDENKEHEGSEVNAMRHALWQATITRKFGEAIASHVGYAHEDTLPKDLSIRTFTGASALSQADTAADLLNNVKGREIGKANPSAKPQELATKTLDYFHAKGLFTAKRNPDGSVTISQTKITDQKYQKGLAIIKGLNDNAFTAAEQKAIDARARWRP
jgi:RHS repeat-associated protein